MRLRLYRHLSLFFLCSELLFLNSLFYLSLLYEEVVSNIPELWVMGGLLNVCWLAVFFLGRHYEIRRQLGVWQNMKRLSISLVLFALVTLFLGNMGMTDLISFRALAIFLASFTCIALFWRMFLYYLLIHYRKRGYNLRNFVVVGYSKEGRYLEHYFSSYSDLGYVFKGYFDVQTQSPRVKGGLSDLISYAQQQPIHLIYWCLPSTYEKDLAQVVDFADQHLIKVCIIPRMMQFYGKSTRLYRYGPLPVLDISYSPLDDMINVGAKRSFDLLFSTCILLFILSWMIPLFGLLIKLFSRGPVFFVQRRHGKQNSVFRCYKFRTMRIDKEGSNFKQATRNDPRVTAIGRWMRKASIDEMPQFVNVFLGHMSVVGPRPHVVSMNQEFSKMIDQFWLRHRVKPGVTGLAQCKGYRGECTSLHDVRGRIHLDKFYVKNWSFLLDIQIILSTLRALFIHRDKSY